MIHIDGLQDHISLPTGAVVEVITALLEGDVAERDVYAHTLLAMLITNEGIKDRAKVVSLVGDIMQVREAMLRREEIPREDIENIQRRISEAMNGGGESE